MSSDWVLTTDPSTGSPYYHNSITGESSWEDPTYNIDSGGVHSAKIDQRDVLDVFGNNSNDSSGKDDEDSGGAAFSGNMLGLTKLAQQRQGQQRNQSPNRGPTSSSSLPNALIISPVESDDNVGGWQECSDENGNIYYHNLLSGESVWEEPEEHKMSREEDLAQAREGSVEKEKDSEKAENRTGVGEKKVDDRWQEMRDDSGRQYWYDSSSDKITYTNPTNNKNNDEEEDFEEADYEQEDWPITDTIVGTLGHLYAQRVGMSDEAYSKVSGVKCGVPEKKEIEFEKVKSAAVRVTKKEVFKELDNLMISSFQLINKTFRDMDVNRDGTLQPSEFREALKIHGMVMSDENFMEVWREFDEDDDGNITYKEFVQKYIHREGQPINDFYAWSIYPWRKVQDQRFNKETKMTEDYVYYQHTITNQTQMEVPEYAFEKKIDALSRLTPRDSDNPGNGEFMWREEPEEERRRQRYERQKKRDAEKEKKRRAENPTEDEQVTDVLRDMVDSVTYHLVREDRLKKHKERVGVRAIWHPASKGFHMKELPQGGQGSKGTESRRLVTDIMFFDAKVTMCGDVVNWTPQSKEPYKTKSQGRWQKLKLQNKFTGGLKTDAAKTAKAKGLAEIVSKEKKNKAAAAVAFKLGRDDGETEAGLSIKPMDGVEDPSAEEEGKKADEELQNEILQAESKRGLKGLLLRMSGKTGKKDGEIWGGGEEGPERSKGSITSLLSKINPRKTTASAKPPPVPAKDADTDANNDVNADEAFPPPPSQPITNLNVNETEEGTRERKDSFFRRLSFNRRKKGKISNGEKTEIEIRSPTTSPPLSPTTLGRDGEFVKNKKLSKSEKKDLALVEKKKRIEHWKYPRPKPIDTARVCISLALKIPPAYEIRTVTEAVVKDDAEGAKDGKTSEAKKETVKTVVYDTKKRDLFDKKLRLELAEMAGAEIEDVVIEEAINRDIDVGYYERGKWIIGKAGEFKSKVEEDMERMEKEEEELKRSSSRKKSFLPTLKKIGDADAKAEKVVEDEIEQKRDKEAEASSSLSLPAIDDANPREGEVVIKLNKKTSKGARQRRAANLKRKMSTNDLVDELESEGGAKDMNKRRKEFMENKQLEQGVKVYAEYEKNKKNKDKYKLEEKEIKYDRHGKRLNKFQAAKLAAKSKTAKLSSFSTNVGSYVKLRGGFGTSRGNFVITIVGRDGDPAIHRAMRIKAIVGGHQSNVIDINRLTANAVRVDVDNSGEVKFFDQWEHYWTHIINPVFFGYSTERIISRRKRLILGPKPPRKPIKFRDLEAEYERACSLYKREFAKGLVQGKYWTPEQYKVKQARDRAEFRLILQKKHVARLERKKKLLIEPEPWKRKTREEKVFTLEEVEKWKDKAAKREWKERSVMRARKKKEHAARQEILQDKIWDRKVENWLQNKLLSFNQNKQELANVMKAEKENDERTEMERIIHENNPENIEANNARLSRQKEAKKKEAEEVKSIYDALNTTGEQYPTKKAIMTALSKNKELKGRCKRVDSLSPLFNVQFVNAFMLQPARSSGRVSRKEFCSFGAAVATVGQLYLRAKRKTEDEKERKKKKEAERKNKKEELRNLRKVQKQRRETVKMEKEEKERLLAGGEEGVLVVGGIVFKKDQRRDRATDRIWEKFHHKCIIKVNQSRNYCCNTRRKKYESDIKSLQDLEEDWRLDWDDKFFEMRTAKEKETKELIELRINSGAQELSAAQRATTKKCLDDIIGQVINRAWVEREVAEVVWNLADKVSLKEAYRLHYSHQGNVFSELEDEKKEEEWNSRELIEGWTAYLDEESGAYYYENASTGEATWERPVRPLTPPLNLNLKHLNRLDEKSNAIFAAGVKKYTASSFLKEGEFTVEKIGLSNVGGVGSEGDLGASAGMNILKQKKPLTLAEKLKQANQQAHEVDRENNENLNGEMIKDNNDVVIAHGIATDQNGNVRVSTPQNSKIALELYDVDVANNNNKKKFLGTTSIPYLNLTESSDKRDQFGFEVVTLDLKAASGHHHHNTAKAMSVENVTGSITVAIGDINMAENSPLTSRKWKITVLRGNNLARASHEEKNDTICEIKWHHELVGTTTVVKDSQNPVWTTADDLENTVIVPSDVALERDNEKDEALRKKTRAKTIIGKKKMVLGSILKKGMLNVKQMVGLGMASKAKIVNELEERVRFWEAETTREEMERRYLFREEVEQKKNEEVRLRAIERPLRDEQESGHRNYLEIVNLCRGLRSGLLRYKWHRTLLSGNMEMTCQVQDPSSGFYQVIKFLPCEYEEDVVRVVEEAELIGDITHRSIVRVKSVERHLIQRFTLHGSAHQQWHLAAFVFEWCGGGKLVDYIRTVDFLEIDPHTMQGWCQNVAEGLKVLHELGLTHRNLNPGNVYLDSGGRAKVGGYMCFKAARAPGCIYSMGRCDTGSWSVVSPEVEAGYEVGPKADIFAFGCCMFYWCTGKLPNVAKFGVEATVREVSLHFGERVRGAIRMALQPNPDVRADSEELWKYLSVQDMVKQKRGRALAKLRRVVGAKKGIDHGDKSVFGRLVDQVTKTENKFLLAASKSKGM